jgi:hypothetical protein
MENFFSSAYSKFLNFHTYLSLDDALEAKNLWESDIEGKQQISDPEVCKKIQSNSILRQLCGRNKIQWLTPSISNGIVIAAKSVGHLLIFAICMPISTITGQVISWATIRNTYADFDNIQNHGRNTPENWANACNENGNLVGSLLTKLAKKDNLRICCDNETITNARFQAFERAIYLPKCILLSEKGSSPEALATAMHEYGHSQQSLFLMIWCSLCKFLSLAIFLYDQISRVFDLPFFSKCYGPCIFIMTLAPIINFFYEVDASKRAMATIINENSGNNLVTNDGAMATIVQNLQLAATTYLFGSFVSIWEIICLLKFYNPFRHLFG